MGSMSKTLAEQLCSAIGLNPEIENILHQQIPLEEKRIKLRAHLAVIVTEAADSTVASRPMEWILKRDAAWVLRNIFNPRSEELSGFSVLEFIDAIVNGRSPSQAAEVTRGFVLEIEHLLRAIGERT